LQELLKRLQEKHGKCAEALTNKAATDAQAAADVHTPNVLQAMILFQQAQNRAKAEQDHAKTVQDQAKVANKGALEAEKDNDADQKRVARAATGDDVGRVRMSCTQPHTPDLAKDKALATHSATRVSRFFIP
jgi:hypothetical protein